MAASDSGGSYRPNQTSGDGLAKNKRGKLTAEERRKVRRRTTPSSRARARERYLGDNRPRADRPSAAKPKPKPKPVDPLTRRARQDAALRYGPAMNEVQQLRQATPGYFDQYRAQVTGAGNTYTAQAAPIVQQAQQTQTTAGQVAPGAAQDPDAQLAAQSRAALTGLGLTALQGIVSSNQGYFAGRAGPVAAAQQLSTQRDLNREYGDLKQERGAYVASRRGELQEKQHTQRLENAAFGLDTYEAETERRDKARDDRRAKREDRRERREKGREVNSYGYSDKEWRAFTPEQRRRIMREVKAEQRAPSSGDDKGLTPTQLRARREKRGKAISRVKEIPSLWDEYADRTNRVPVYNSDGTPKTNEDGDEITKVVKPTEAQIRSQLRKDGYSQSEITLALAVKRGKPLTASERAMARRMGIYPIPKAWKQRPPTNRPGHAPAEGGNRPT